MKRTFSRTRANRQIARSLSLVAVLGVLAISSCGDNSDHAVATPADALQYRLTERSWILRSSNGRRIQEPLSGTFQLALAPNSVDSRLYGISSIQLSSPSFAVDGAALHDQSCGSMAEGCLQLDNLLNTEFDAVMQIRVNAEAEIQVGGQAPLYSGLRVLTVQLCDVSLASCESTFAGITNGYVLTIDAELVPSQ